MIKGMIVLLLLSAQALAQNPINAAYVEQELIIMKDENIKTHQELINLHQIFQVQKRSDFKVFKNLEVIRLPKKVKLSEAIKAYKTVRGIVAVERNYIYGALLTKEKDISDPLFYEQWALSNTGQRGGTVGADIGALKAWDLAKNNRNITVAVIDTGVDYEHEDLKHAMWVNEKEIPRNGIDDDANGFVDDIHGYNFYDKNGAPKDDHMHGTHCSGIIAAKHNDKGIRGLWPHAKIMAVKFLGPFGDGTLENGILAIEYALLNGAHIMSNSWGGPPYSEILDHVVARVNQAQILFVAAAGNDHSNNDSDPTYPASYTHENVISVAASNPLDRIASFTNWGTQMVHLAAPGRHIVSSVLENKYRTASGTSMAAPYVSGAAAMLLSHFPNMTIYEAKKRLMDTVTRQYIYEEQVVSGGRLNVYNALEEIITPPLGSDPSWSEMPYQLSSPHNYPNMANLSWKITIPGAKVIRIHFKRFETEKRLDYVGMADFQGIMRETLSGNQGSLWSRSITGDTVDLTLRSDSVNPGYGFDIDKIQYK